AFSMCSGLSILGDLAGSKSFQCFLPARRNETPRRFAQHIFTLFRQVRIVGPELFAGMNVIVEQRLRVWNIRDSAASATLRVIARPTRAVIESMPFGFSGG
ncbi:MAG: hypothetical protein MI757_16855, partial [Pirellulales bacterium]|nr:hypothetical protein [Pirellulales bacterium]